jgi:hypothetical protein
VLALLTEVGLGAAQRTLTSPGLRTRSLEQVTP